MSKDLDKLHDGNTSSVVHVVVLGDIGHSPRMLNHCECLLRHQKRVRIIGYLESELPKFVKEGKIEFYELVSFRSYFIIFRVVLLALQLFFYLALHVRTNETILVQNPPALPLLLVGFLFRPFKRIHICVDWHNFGHCLIGLKYGMHSWLVFVHKQLERIFAQQATAHFCVTSRIKDVIMHDFGIR